MVFGGFLCGKGVKVSGCEQVVRLSEGVSTRIVCYYIISTSDYILKNTLQNSFEIKINTVSLSSCNEHTNYVLFVVNYKHANLSLFV